MPEDTFEHAEPVEGGQVVGTREAEADAIPLDIAAKRLSLTQAALRMRLRRGKAEGYKIDGRWYVYVRGVGPTEATSDEDANVNEAPPETMSATLQSDATAEASPHSDQEHPPRSLLGDPGGSQRSDTDLDHTHEPVAPERSPANATDSHASAQGFTATSESAKESPAAESRVSGMLAADSGGMIEAPVITHLKDELVEPVNDFIERQTSSGADVTTPAQAREPARDSINSGITHEVADTRVSSRPDVEELEGDDAAAQEATSLMPEGNLAADYLKEVEGPTTTARQNQTAPALTEKAPEQESDETATQNAGRQDQDPAADDSVPSRPPRRLPFLRSSSSRRPPEKNRTTDAPVSAIAELERAISDTADRITALSTTNGTNTTSSLNVATPTLAAKAEAGKTDRREPRLSVPEPAPIEDVPASDRDLSAPSPERGISDSRQTDGPQEKLSKFDSDPLSSAAHALPTSVVPAHLPANYQLYQPIAIPIAPVQQEPAAKTGEGEDGKQQTLLQNLDVVWRKKRVVFSCMVMFVTLAWVALSQVAPRYTAEALVLIKPSADKVVDIESVVSGLADDPTEILNQVQILRSRRLAERVIDETGLSQLAEFNPILQAQQSASSPWSELISRATELFRGASASPREPAIVDEEQLRTKIVNKFRDALRVAPIGESSVISVNFTSQKPGVAALVTNKIADLYVLDQLEAKYEGTQLAAEWLQGRIGVLRETVQESEAAVEQFRANAGLLKSSSNTTLLTEQITQFSSQRAEARAELADIQSKLSIAEKLAQENDLRSLADVMNSPVILQQKREEALVLRRRAELASEVGPRHPLFVNLTAELRDIQDQLDREVNSVLSRMRADVRVAKTRLDTLTNELADFEGNAEEANQAQIGLRALEREASANRTLFETFLNRFKETEEQEELSRPDARVISYAAVPQEPSFPKKGIVLLAAVIVSGLFGVFLAFMLDLAQSKLQSLDQIEALGLPPLALIPLLSTLRSKKKPQDHILDSPGSAYAESLRALHTSILVSDVENRTRCVLITSTVPGEGKTTLAVSLARLLAGMGSKVLLVDCDMRRPAVHAAMSVANDVGLIDHMVGSMSRSAITRKDPKSNVAIVTPGRLTRNAMDLLRSRQMRELINAFKQDYDMVILDSAPLLPVSDARILAGVADTTIFAVKWRSTRRRHVKSAIRLLRDARANVLGAALTQVDVQKHAKERYSDSGYYTKAYNAYYTD